MKEKSYEKNNVPEPPTEKFRGSLREHPLPNDPENPENIINYTETEEFSDDLERLSKKYPSLPKDLEKFKYMINIAPLRESEHSHVIEGNEQCAIVKVNLPCRYLKGPHIRIFYAFFHKSREVRFIKIYYRSDNKKEDYGWVNICLKNLKKLSKTT